MKDIATTKSPETKSPTPWKTILVPVDFSDRSQQAATIGACLAEQSGATVIFLHVVEFSNAVETGRMAYEVMDAARRSLDKMAGEISAPLARQKLVCVDGHGISEKIVEVAREVSSDLIVLGTHDMSAFKRAFLGSTAESVNRHAPCPVLIVRQNKMTNQITSAESRKHL